MNEDVPEDFERLMVDVVEEAATVAKWSDATVVTYDLPPAAWPDEDVPTTRHQGVRARVTEGWVEIDSLGEVTIVPRERVKEVYRTR